MNKFCKQTGIKSKIMNLHARMVDIEKRIIRMTLQQEDMIREIVTKLIAFVKNSNDGENNVLSFLAQLNNESGQLETLARILAATNKLRKELDTFRTCCNRLIVIEDERNSLVEQVYSMPVSQRLSYGVLLAAQYEKMRLEREVQEIKQEQLILQERLKHLSNTNPNINNIQPLTDENDLKVHKMLEAVNCEAVNLLALTKDQKDKYIQEIARLKENNMSLSQQVASLQQVDQEKEDLEYKMSLAIKELQKLKEMDHNKSTEYSVRVQTLVEENNILQEKLKHYYNIEDQVKLKS
ncbi:hypothetical protein ILUMI_15494 [Ignelater luminosus]|uniref:Uncharacterized protein n=1 Tax=Ignelater luminosus TaxID=2038154 RepID=A0A8K0CNG6_IGNLU|nr:hypothetical protein ILUMI_15494 [Ignelater luminosus]